MSDGLGGRDVFDLGWSRQGQLAAATNHGLFLFDATTATWQPSRMVQIVKAAPAAGGRGKKVLTKAHPTPVSTLFEGRASALAMGNRRWYAATDAGLLHSDDQGASWSGGPLGSERAFISVSAYERVVAAASVRAVWYSANYGQHWTPQPLPPEVTRVYSVTVTGEDTLWAATREGALRWVRRSLDEGSWEHVTNGLPAHEVTSIREQDGLLLAAVAASHCWYVSRDGGKSWTASEPAEFEVSGAVLQGGTLYVTTRHHGVLVQEPQAALRPKSVAAR